MDSRMKSSLAVAALENAVRARRPAGTVVHSLAPGEPRREELLVHDIPTNLPAGKFRPGSHL